MATLVQILSVDTESAAERARVFRPVISSGLRTHDAYERSLIEKEAAAIAATKAYKRGDPSFDAVVRVAGDEYARRTLDVGGTSLERYNLSDLLESTSLGYQESIDAVRVLPEGSTWEEVSQLVYGTEAKAGMLTTANSARYEETARGVGLPAGIYVICPDVYGITRSESSESLAKVDVTVRPPDDPVPSPAEQFTPRFSVDLATPDWLVWQKDQLGEEGNSKGLVILLFYRPAPNATWEKVRRVDGVTDFRSRSSVFEAVNLVEFTIPFTEALRADYDAMRAHRFANRVVVGYNGVPIFCGILVNPKLDTKKGVTLTWTALSHSYVAVQTHINPVKFTFEWQEATPLVAIGKLMEGLGLPIIINSPERVLLEKPYVDEEGLSNIATDIQGTTPFKFIEKYVSSIGRFLTSTVDGLLCVTGVGLTEEPTVFLTDDPSSAEAEDLPSAVGIFSVSYSFNELAKDYSVFSQRRVYDDLTMVTVEDFPLPIFKNVVRDEAKASSLPRVAEELDLGDLPALARIAARNEITEKDLLEVGDPFFALSDEEADRAWRFVVDRGRRYTLSPSQVSAREEYIAREKERRLASGAAMLEMAKSFARAVKIEVEVPSWTNPVTGKPWIKNSTALVRSEKNGLPYHKAVVSSVEFLHKRGRKSAKLQMALLGQFDMTLPRSIPFLWDNDTPVKYTAKSYEELMAGQEKTQ